MHGAANETLLAGPQPNSSSVKHACECLVAAQGGRAAQRVLVHDTCHGVQCHEERILAKTDDRIAKHRRRTEAILGPADRLEADRLKADDVGTVPHQSVPYFDQQYIVLEAENMSVVSGWRARAWGDGNYFT